MVIRGDGNVLGDEVVPGAREGWPGFAVAGARVEGCIIS